jgi:probable addiction module antidote protein
MPIETAPWDPTERLRTPEAERLYLEAAFEDGDPALIAAALGDVVRARGATKIAEMTGVTRDAIYKGLNASGNPTVRTLTEVARALGYRLSIEPLDPKAA